MPSDTDFTSNCSWAITEDMTESQIKALQVRAKTALEDGQVKAGHIRSACKLLKWTPKNITRVSGSHTSVGHSVRADNPFAFVQINHLSDHWTKSVHGDSRRQQRCSRPNFGQANARRRGAEIPYT